MLELVARLGPSPATVLEPTCGEGTFLAAAADAFPQARLVGYDIHDAHLRTARARLPRERTTLRAADFFRVSWEREVTKLAGPILVTGNPPWVTSAALGVLGSKNVPHKENWKGLRGLDARTGKSNFDLAEWMVSRLVDALAGRRATLAVLCKTAVARRVIEQRPELAAGGLWRVDAARHFGALVSAALFVAHTGRPRRARGWPVYASLEARSPESTMQVAGGVLLADAAKRARTEALDGASDPEWRSGIKHDCARVMELSRRDGELENGLGERVRIEDELVFPLLKCTDVARGVVVPTRAVLVTQRALGEDTRDIARRAPRAWAYLTRHEGALAARKSSIYREKPAFAMFGVGPYSFAPWKVAVSGLHKRCDFRLVGPHQGKPVMLDDACYFLPFAEEDDARRACEALASPPAQDFLHARIFWDDKRPIRKATLQRLDLARLLAVARAPRRTG